MCGKPHTQPFHWWGLPWTPPNPRTLSELIEQGMMSDDTARFLKQHVRNGGSIVVAAGAAGAGKSTLAHALTAEIPLDRTRIYIRGTYESFDWLNETDAESTTILVNEISPHLATYCWGESAQIVLRLAAKEYQVIATLHADTVSDLTILLKSRPICASAAQVVALDVVVFLNAVADTEGATRRTVSLVRLEMDNTLGEITGRDLPM